MSSHLRRRSIDMSESTVIDMGSYHDRSDSPQFYIDDQEESRPLQPVPVLAHSHSPDSSPSNWTEKVRSRSIQGNGSRGRAWLVPLLLMSTVGGWIAGSRTNELPKHLRLSSNEEFLADQTLSCNPYAQRGILLVNMTVAKENKWQPIDKSTRCEPTDWLSMITARDTSPQLDFVRNRTIVLFGDSVDRDHNLHFCQFVQGTFEMIGPQSSLSPPYPVGEEMAPLGYQSYVDASRNWPTNDQSRPWLCTIPEYGLQILSVFHYGYTSSSAYITGHPHYYPPLLAEDRFSHIIQPILHNLAAERGSSAIPDLISFSPSFWGLLRFSEEDKLTQKKMIKLGGHTEDEEEVKKLGAWEQLSEERREMMKRRIGEIIRTIARAFPMTSAKSSNKPRILLRSLHHVKAQNAIPYNRVQTLNQISLSVVENLIAEGKAALRGELSWRAWVKLFKSGESRSAALTEGLGSRLVVDDWGEKLTGNRHHFRDQIHPLPLPGSWLYGQMLIEQLRMTVEEEVV